MQGENVSVRINFVAREIELSGSSAEVAAWWERLGPIVLGFGEPKSGALKNGSREPDRSPSVPEAFGEFLHDFPSSITDVDKVLAAAFFVQGHDPENCFTTAQASKLLLEHSIKIGNPSQCVKQNVDKKHVFVFNGKYRVSKAGVDHLQQMKAQLS